MTQTAWQIWRKKYLYFSTKHRKLCRFEEISIFFNSTKQKKNSLNILGLPWRIEEINIFIILPSIKNSLNILGLLCRFEEINKLIKYTWSSKHKTFAIKTCCICRVVHIFLGIFHYHKIATLTCLFPSDHYWQPV